MNTPSIHITNDCIKEAICEQIRQIPSPQEECIRSSWQKVSQILTHPSKVQ
ncbi:hypothetical protein ACFFK0_01220 [Paenibacillus chartarius]|uniref:Uncharacterized protein n=1 Tax=Paenibacillus chartarius TaxID=747481 RepID=A0ABV6DEJ8_9BACL